MLSASDRQQAVLDTLGRAGAPLTLRELQDELPQFGMASILRSLDVLESRGLTTSSGNRAWAFVHDPEIWDGPVLAPDEIARFWLAA